MRRTVRRLGGVIVAVVLLVAGSGCVQQKVTGDVITYTYDWWVGVATALGAVAAVIVGWFIITLARPGFVSWLFGIRRFALGLLVGGPVMVVMVIPTVVTHYVQVDADHFEVRHRWWWSPTRHNVRFDQLQAIGVFEGFVKDGEASDSYLDCVSQAGKHEQVELDPLVRRALPNLLKRAEQRGVRVVRVEAPKHGDPGNDEDDDR